MYRPYRESDKKRLQAVSDEKTIQLIEMNLKESGETVYVAEIDESDIVAIGGLKFKMDHYQAWLHVDDRVRDNIFSFVRFLKAVMPCIYPTVVSVDETFPKACRLVEILGFTPFAEYRVFDGSAPSQIFYRYNV